MQRGVDLFTREKEKLDAQMAAGGPDSTALGGMLAGFSGYGQKHADVIKKWGRFPHRCVGLQNHRPGWLLNCLEQKSNLMLDKALTATASIVSRNAILGRENTPEEAQGLADGTIAK